MSPEYAKSVATFSYPHKPSDSDSDRSPPSAAVAGQPSPLSATTKKPRGRPPGSKNRPKPPVVVTRDCDSTMKTAILEIPAGSDVIDMITNFARRRRVGVTLLSGSGSVSNVTLRHTVSHAPGSLVSLHGPFHLLSLWGSFMGFKAGGACGDFSITLSGVQGQVFGGVVGGKVVAAGTVVVVAATYLNPTIESLTAAAHGGEDDEKLPETGGSGSPMAADVKPWIGDCGGSCI